MAGYRTRERSRIPSIYTYCIVMRIINGMQRPCEQHFGYSIPLDMHMEKRMSNRGTAHATCKADRRSDDQPARSLLIVIFQYL